MIKPRMVIVPRGTCDQKTRFLMDGFSRLGIGVEVLGASEKIGVTQFNVLYDDGREVICGHDIGCLQKHELSRGKGEAHPWWEGRTDVLFFKTHSAPDVLNRDRKIFPIPQALGRPGFADMIDGLREKRRTEAPSLDIFGVFTDGGLRSEACDRIKTGPWASFVGIFRARKGHPVVDRRVRTAALNHVEYLATMARSRLALSLPSTKTNEGPWISYRHVEAWALGVPIVTIRPANYHIFAEPKTPFWFDAALDLSDLGLVINQALEDRERLADYGRRSMAYYDAHYRPERQAEYVLRVIEQEGLK